jgi:hypothetical protein
MFTPHLKRDEESSGHRQSETSPACGKTLDRLPDPLRFRFYMGELAGVSADGAECGAGLAISSPPIRQFIKNS